MPLLRRVFPLLTLLCAVNAQNRPQIGIFYTCNSGAQKLKITSCSSGSNATCDVQFFGTQTPPQPTGTDRLTREQMAGLLGNCVLPNGEPALATIRVPARPATSTGSKAQPKAQPSANAAWKVGDVAMAYSMFGWIQVRILEIKGNEYRLQYLDQDNVWVKASNLRRVNPVTTRSGVAALPPGGSSAPAAVSCAGRLEGTYADQAGLLSVLFRGGKASVTKPQAGTYEADCRIQGRQIVLQGTRAQDRVVLTQQDARTLVDRDAGAITKRD